MRLGIIKKGKIFYGWFIVLASVIVTGAGIGVFTSTNSVFVKPICDSFGFSRGEFTLYRTIITLVGAFLMPVYAKLMRKYSIKRILLISSVSLSLVTFTYSFATQLWHFYAIAAVNGLFVNGVNFMVVGVLVSRWFDDKKGFATGLAYCGSGLGGAIMLPIVGQMVEQVGWQWSYRAIAFIGLLILLPTVLFIVRESPQSMGLKPYVDKNKPVQENGGVTVDSVGLTLKQAMKTPTFWMLVTSFFLVSILAAGPNTHTIPYLTDIGYSTTFATSVVSFVMILLTIGKIGLGMIFDRFGTLAGSIFVGVCCLTFPLLALIAYIPVVPWVYAVFFGLASSGFSVPVTVLVTKYFGTKDFATIFSICTMVTTFGTSAAVPLMGAIYDATNSYNWAWIMLFTFAVIIMVCFIGANITSRKLLKKNVAVESV